MDDLTPITRLEYDLDGIVNNHSLLDPITRLEMYLSDIAAGRVSSLSPITRIEMYLAKISGASVEVPAPITRIEMYLAAIAGEDVETPDPITRVEYWLDQWAEQSGSGVITTVTGTSPLALANALDKPIKKLIQFGKVATVDNETYCNNGKLVAVDDELPNSYERQIGFKFSASTYYLISDFHLRGSDTVRLSFSADKACNVFGCYTTNSASDNYSLYASTSSGGKYLRYDGATYNSYIPSAQIGERIDAVITPDGTSGMPTDSVITPAEFEATADLCIGTTSTSASSSKLDGNIWGNFEVDGRLTLIPCKRLSDDALGYYDLDSDTFYEPVGSAPTSLGVDTSHLTALSVVGTPEVLTVGEQTASVENLLAVDNIADEQNIISGAVTRRCEAVVSDGTTPSGRYIGEVGEGNIIVKVRETGYEGDVATFEADRAKPLNGLTVNVEPIQDLHGYDSPWPAGVGKNKFNPAEAQDNKWINNTTGEIESVSGFWITGFIPVKSGDVIRSAPKGSARNAWYNADKSQATYFAFNGEGSATAPSDGFVVLAVSSSTVAYGSDFIVTINNADLTFSPYSNICPISGRTSATVTRTGKNLFPDAGDITAVANKSFMYNSPIIFKGQTVTLSFSDITYSGGFTSSVVFFIRANSAGIANLNFNTSTKSKTWTATEDVYGINFYATSSGATNPGVTTVYHDAQLELGSTASAYEPYQSDTYTIQLGDTVYGGTLDVTGGKMVVDMAMVDLGTLNWQYDSVANFKNFWAYGFTVIALPPNNGKKANILCSNYKTITANEGYLGTELVGIAVAINQRLFVYDPNYSDASVFKTAMSGVQLCYELATPFEITLTPTQIETLIGENNLCADAGSVKAYVADGDVIEHVTAQPMRTAEGINIVTVTSAVAPVQLSATYIASD